MTAELAVAGSQCRGERHEQVIARQRDALVELRAKIRVMESGNKNPRMTLHMLSLWCWSTISKITCSMGPLF